MTDRTLYVRREVINQNDLRSWANWFGCQAVVRDLHATIAYSTWAFDWSMLPKSADRVVIHGPLHTTRFGDRCVLLLPEGTFLQTWQMVLMSGGLWDYPTYRPHVTITKTPCWLDRIYYGPALEFGPEIWSEIPAKEINAETQGHV